MAVADVQTPPAEPAAAAMPDYLTSPNSVFADDGVQWRYGKAPDYSKTRAVWETGKTQSHAAGSLEQLVENLVKNWEVEASFKPRLQDWRTIDPANYTFAINGGPPQSAEHMLKVGTYNAIIAPNEYYSPENSDFASSHKTFKRMMPTFAWEVIEVYSGPPKVAFKWRHWGVMKQDYVGFNDKGEKIVAKAHGGPIEIFGVTVAAVDEKVRLQTVDTWFDPLDMFRQIAPNGIVNKTPMNRTVDPEKALDDEAQPVAAVQPTAETVAPTTDGVKIAEQHASGEHSGDKAPEDMIPKHDSENTGNPADQFLPHPGADTSKTAEQPAATDFAPAAASIEAAATEGANADIERPAYTLHDAHGQQRSSNIDSSVKDSREGVPTLAPSDPDHSQYSSSVTGNLTDRIEAGRTGDFPDESRTIRDAVDEHPEGSAEKVHRHPHDAEEAVQPQPGEAVAVPAGTEETRLTYGEMSRIGAGECPFLMNRE